MFDSILVPVDLTEKNRHAMDAAATLARGRDAAKLTLLHVIASIEHVPYEELADFYATLEQRAGEALEGWRQELADQGLQVGWEIVLGRRTAEIVRWAGEHEVDLIVMESHRIDPQHPTEGLATLSHQVAVLAPCPVLLVK